MRCTVRRLWIIIGFSSFFLTGQWTLAQSIRRDITTLSADELVEYRDAFRQMQQSGEYARIAGYHGCPGHYCHIDSRIFLPWHRAYVLELEKALRKVNPRLALHYWDWTSSVAIQNGIPRAFADLQYVSGGSTFPNPLRRFRYQCGGRDRDTARSPDQPFLLGQLRDQVNDAYRRTTYDSFNTGSRGLRPPHDSLHNWVGGEMGIVEWAAYDPIFWAHHSNIDRQWARWQDSSSGSDPSENIKALELEPFGGTTVRDVLNYRNLGYTYDRLTEFVQYKLPGTGTITIKNFRIPPPGTPIGLYAHDFPAHPPKSFRVYVFVNQPTATVDDVRPNNPNFAGFFGIFGGQQGEARKKKGVKHVDLPTAERILDLAPAIRRVVLRDLENATFTITVIATDADGEIAPVSELPFDRLSLQVDEKSERQPGKQGHDREHSR